MADNLGTLGLELVLKSKMDAQLQSYQKEVDKLTKKIEQLEKKKFGPDVSKDQLADYNRKIKETTSDLRKQQTAYKSMETRMQQVLDKAHDLSNVIKTATAASKNAKFFDTERTKRDVEGISAAIKSLMQIVNGGKDSPFMTGVGFKSYMGDVKRSLADVKKDIKSVSSESQSKANKEVSEAQKALDKAAKAEEKAVEYYRTRKQAVDNAITSLSSKQAEFARLARNSTAEDARMLKEAGEQAEILKQRLLAAKTEYEQMQRLKATGTPGAALSSTFLGRYTGMSELFGREPFKYGSDTFRGLLGGRNAKEDNLSYKDFLNKQAEVVSLVRQHNSELREQERLQDRINRKQNPLENRHIDISSEIRAQKDLSALQSKQVRDEEQIQRAVAKTVERYEYLSRVIREAQAARRGTYVTKEQDALTQQIARINSMRHALRAELNSNRGYSTNLYNSGEAKVAIDNLRELTKAQKDLNDERRKSAEKYSKELGKERVESERIYQQTIEKTAADLKRQEETAVRSFKAEQDAIDKTTERYNKLRSIFSEGLSVRNDSRMLGLDADRLTEKLREILPMILELRQAYNAHTFSDNLFNKGDAKVAIDDLRQLTRAYSDLNREKAKSVDAKNVRVSDAWKLDTKPIERQIEQYERAISIYKEMVRLQADIQAGAAMGARNKNSGLLGEDYTKAKQELESLKATFDSLSNGFTFDRLKSELESLYRLLSQFESANNASKPIIYEPHNPFDSERERLNSQAKYQQREREIQEAFDREARNVERVNELLSQRAHKSQMEAAAEKERIAAAEQRFSVIEQKMRQLAQAYSQVREQRDRASMLRMDTRDLDYRLAVIRHVFSELNSLRWGRPANSDLGSAMTTANYQLERAAVEAKRASGNIAEMQEKMNSSVSAARDLASAFDKVHRSASQTSQVMSDIKNLFLQGGIVYAAQSFANSIIQTGGDIVQQHIALRSILNDVSDADELFNQVKQLALQSPFKFQDLNKDVKQLAAFGVDTDKLYDTTKRLADVSSGLGVSFERLGLAYGQVKARSWLDGKELRQFAYAGLPMLQKIADLYNETGKNGRRNYSTSDIRTMITKRQVSFEDVDAVFKRLTDEGGQFYNMQFVLSDTLLGKWNKLQDAWSIMLSEFADGNNIIGRVFAGAINGATNLLMSLDKITPVLMSFATLFAGRKMLGFAVNKWGISSLTATMSRANALAMNNFIIRQRQRVVEGEISAEKYRQLVSQYRQVTASAACRDQTYMQLAAEGKLSTYQIARLAYTKQISQAGIMQLSTMGLLTEKQAVLLRYSRLHAGTFKGFIAQARVGIAGLGAALRGIFSWTNLIFVAIGTVMAAVVSHQQRSSEIMQKASDITKKYSTKASEMKDALNSLGGKITKDTIASMEKTLDKAGQLTDEIRNQVAQADSLDEKYEILRQKMQDTLNMSAQLGNSQIVANAIAASGNDLYDEPNDNGVDHFMKGLSNVLNVGGRFFGLTPEYIDTNIKKINELTSSAGVLKSGLTTSFADIDKAFKNATDAANDSVFFKKIDKLPFEERIEAILRSKYADQFLWELQYINAGAYETAKKLQKYLQDYDNHLNEVVNTNIPILVQSLKDQLGLVGNDTSRWSQAQVAQFVWMFEEIMAAAGEMSDYVRSKIYKAFFLSSNLSGQLNPSGLRVVSHYHNGKKTGATYIGQEGDDKQGHYIVTGFEKEKQNGLYVPHKIYTSAADKPKPQAIPARSDDGGKTGKGTKASNAADKAERERERRQREAVRQMQRELDIVKNSYSWYEKYYDALHSKPSALEAVKSVYGQDLKSIGLDWNNTDNYVANLEKVRADVQAKIRAGYKDSDMLSLKKQIDEMLQDEDFKKLTNDMDDYSKQASHQIDILTDKWEMYKNVLESTGDVALASSVSQIRSGKNYYGADVMDKQGLYGKRSSFGSNSLKNDIESRLGDLVFETEQNWKPVTDKNGNVLESDTERYRRVANTTIDYDRVSAMSDDEIEKYVGSLFKDYPDKSQTKAFIELLEKFKSVKAQEIKDAVSVLVEILKMQNVNATSRKTAVDDSQKRKDNLDLLLSRGKKGERGGIDQATYDKGIAVAQADMDDRLLKADQEYDRFTNNILSMTERAAEAIRNRILRNIDEKISAGIGTSKEYADEIKEVNDKMYEFHTAQRGFAAFLTGGIDGWLESRREGALSKYQEGAARLLVNPNDATGRELMESGKAALSKNEKEREQVKSYTDLNKKIHGVAEAFQTLIGAMQPLVDLSEALGNKGISKGASIAGSAIQSGLSAADSMKGMADIATGLGADGVGKVLGKMGPYAAVASAALSVGSQLINKFGFGAKANKEWQKQNDYLKNLQDTVSDINGTLKDRMSSEPGSKAMSYAKEMTENDKRNAEETRKSYYLWTQAHTLHKNHRNRMYTNLDYDQINDYLRSIGYTGEDVTAQTIQNLSGDVLEKIKEHFAGMWAQIPEDARNYLDTLIKIEGESGSIVDTTKELSKAITDLDTDSMVSEWKEMLTNLDSDNQDFADSFQKHMENAIIGGMISNLYKDRMQALIDEWTSLGSSEKGNSYVSKSGAVKVHTGADDSTDVLSEWTPEEYAKAKAENEELAAEERNMRDQLRDFFGWISDGGSTSSSIQGMTEQTADLLASYLNAIRADVSVIRQLTIPDLDAINTTTQAQLQQLDQIAKNTALNAEIAGRIEGAVSNMNTILERANNGTKPLSVSVS